MNDVICTCYLRPWLCSDTFCTSGFVDDVIDAHRPRLLDVAAPSRSAVHTQSWLGYNLCAVIPVAGQRTHGTTFRALKVTSQVATPGAESAVRDCSVAVSERCNMSRSETSPSAVNARDRISE